MPPGPLTGCRVAITRQQRGRLADLLADEGADIVHVPLIDVVDAPGSDLARASERIDRYDWVVVTSAEGARRVAPSLVGADDVRVAAVGSATAATVVDLVGRPVACRPERQSADGLLAAFPVGGPWRILVAQGDLAAGTLVEGLRRRGHDVDAVVAYRTLVRAPDDAERRSLTGCDAVLFASGSAARAWAASFGRSGIDDDGARRPWIVSIGPTTDAAVRAAGLKSDAVATDHSLNGLVDALIRLWSSPSVVGPERR